jgi:CHAD domain-containing protein
MAATRPSDLLIRQRLAAVTRALPAAQGGQVEAIHQARVATRRLREALPLVARGSSGRRLAKLVRRLTRALGPVRELDVALMTLDELRADAEAPADALARLQLLIDEERQRLRVEMARQIERSRIEKVGRKALAAAARHAPGRRPGDPKRVAAARRRAAGRAQSVRAAVENAGAIYLPDRLHQVRISVKKLRYAMEIARDLCGSRATARLRTLKAVQDLLGRMHDLEVLIARIRALQGSHQAPTLKLSADLDRLVRRLETECRQLHVRYIGFKKKLRDVCDHVAAAGEERSTTAA